MWYNQKKGDKKYFNPRPPRGGRRGWIRGSAVGLGISIHAPREGGDIDTLACMWTDAYFNPRPPRGGRPQFSLRTLTRRNFNPRPPRGGRPCKSDMIDYGKHISIHAPREGGDLALRYKATTSSFQSTPPARGATSWPPGCWLPLTFQSTPPARGATNDSPDVSGRYEISIHAPCEGGDSQISTMCWHSADFNPRPPRGGRPGRLRAASPGRVISIHAPREGGDFFVTPWQTADAYFNPRPPRGGRPDRPTGKGGRQRYFNPRPPRGGRHGTAMSTGRASRIFQSTPPARGATPTK